jgi:ribonuclease E
MGRKAKRARVHARRARLLGTPEVAPEPVAEEPVVEAAPEPVAEEPVVEAAPEPVAEEPVVEAAPEPKRVVKAKKPARPKRAPKKKTTSKE